MYDNERQPFAKNINMLEYADPHKKVFQTLYQDFSNSLPFLWNFNSGGG